MAVCRTPRRKAREDSHVEAFFKKKAVRYCAIEKNKRLNHGHWHPSDYKHAVEGGSHPKSIIAEVQIYSTGSWQFPSKVSTLSTVVHKDRPVLWISLLKKAGSSHSQVHSMYYVYVYLHFLRKLPSFGPVNI